MKAYLLKQNGSALITGMIAALSVGVVSAILMQQSQITEKQTRVPRVKSAMVQLETKVRELAFDSSSYETCAPGDSGCQVRLKSGVFQKIQTSMPGAVCSKEGFCGIDLRNESFNPGTSTFNADIVYTGTEVSVAPIRITASVPSVIWKSQASATCSADSPLFVGLNSQGQAVCKALPANCGTGRFLRAVDPMRLTKSDSVSCGDLPSTVNCGPGRYISSVSWDPRNIGSVNSSCTNQKSPFQVASMGADPTAYNYSGDPTYSVPPYPTTTTTDCRWVCPVHHYDSNGNSVEMDRVRFGGQPTPRGAPFMCDGGPINGDGVDLVDAAYCAPPSAPSCTGAATWVVTSTLEGPDPACNFGGGHALANLNGLSCTYGEADRHGVGGNHAGENSYCTNYHAVCTCNAAPPTPTPTPTPALCWMSPYPLNLPSGTLTYPLSCSIHGSCDALNKESGAEKCAISDADPNDVGREMFQLTCGHPTGAPGTDTGCVLNRNTPPPTGNCRMPPKIDEYGGGQSTNCWTYTNTTSIPAGGTRDYVLWPAVGTCTRNPTLHTCMQTYECKNPGSFAELVYNGCVE